MEIINIIGMDKAAVLAALYNYAHPQGMGYLHYTPQDMTVDEAQAILNEYEAQDARRIARLKETGYEPKNERTGAYFDYLKGRVMKIRIEDELYVGLYDRDNGWGAARKALINAGLIKE